MKIIWLKIQASFHKAFQDQSGIRQQIQGGLGPSCVTKVNFPPDYVVVKHLSPYSGMCGPGLRRWPSSTTPTPARSSPTPPPSPPGESWALVIMSVRNSDKNHCLQNSLWKGKKSDPIAKATIKRGYDIHP